eukprot:Skav210859  [mRNA]  locus=scaffold2829:335935:338125:- [translate_table: standard]
MDDILMGCDVKEAWSLGYNGCSFSPDEEEDVPVKWSPAQSPGKGLALCCCEDPDVLDVPLYPFVDLLGDEDRHRNRPIGVLISNTKAVQLVKPTQELVKTAVVNCAKERALGRGPPTWSSDDEISTVFRNRSFSSQSVVRILKLKCHLWKHRNRSNSFCFTAFLHGNSQVLRPVAISSPFTLLQYPPESRVSPPGSETKPRERQRPRFL